MKKALVLGAGGFIGAHLVRRLKREGFWVRGVDLKHPEYGPTEADDFVLGDLRREATIALAFDQAFDEVYQLAADMGGAGYIFTGENDANVMHNSALINLQVAEAFAKQGSGKLFYASSACIYPAYNQTDPQKPLCAESSAYPAQPDSEYGWEKLFSERLFLSFHRNYGLDVRIARFHNIYGPENAWIGGREKAPAAICRKVAQAPNGGTLEIWGDGQQTRSFLYIEDCLDALRLLMDSEVTEPINIGSEEMISINDFTRMVIGISGKQLAIQNVAGPEGVRGRNSDNEMIRNLLHWEPKWSLEQGMTSLYSWLEAQVMAQKTSA